MKLAVRKTNCENGSEGCGMMKTESEIREMRAIIRAFGDPEAVKALDWVLGEYIPEQAALPKAAE